jgi:hypothetical protein
MHGCPRGAGGKVGLVALPVKALKAGQEAYWLDQIARNREEYFSGRGESPGRFVGSAARASGLEGVASAEQVRAMFQGLDPAIGEVRCAPLWRADPRSKLAAAPLLDALKTKAAQRGVEDLEQLARSKALKGDVRAVQAACRVGGSRRVKVETVERLCRKVLSLDPRELYGEGFERAWQHRGKRVNERVQSFDHCFSSPKSVSLLAAGGSDHLRREASCWAAAGPPSTHQEILLGVPGPYRPRRCQRRRPSRPPAASAAPAAPPWLPTAGAAARSWPAGPAAWPGAPRWSPPLASSARCSLPRPACHGRGWLA